AAASQHLAVDPEFAEFVDDDRNAPPLRVAQQMAQHGGFAASQKAGDDGGGDLFQLHEVSSGLGNRVENGATSAHKTVRLQCTTGGKARKQSASMWAASPRRGPGRDNRII